MRRYVAPPRISGGAADRRRGRRDHRLTRAQVRTRPARNRKLRRSLSHPTSPIPRLSRSRQRRRSRDTPLPRAHPCRAAATAARPRSFRCGASSVRPVPPDEGSHFALGASLAATWAGLSHARSAIATMSWPTASCTRSGSAASSLVACATGTLPLTTVPPWSWQIHPSRSQAERTGRRDRRRLKLLRAPGQPRCRRAGRVRAGGALAKRLAPPRGQPLSRRVRRSGDGLDCPIGQGLPRAGPYSLRAAGAIGVLADSQRLGGRGRIGLTLADAVIWVISEVQIGTASFVPGRYGGQARPTGRVDADS